MNAIKEVSEKYSSVYVFSFENMRNQKFKKFREQLKSSSRFFLGSNKVMQVSLGRSPADEIKPGLHKVSKVAMSSLSLNQLFSVLVCIVSLFLIFLMFHWLFLLYHSYCVEMLGCFLRICRKKKLKGNLGKTNILMEYINVLILVRKFV